MTVVDCDAGSPTYGEVVGWTELPTAGNELHHFGWNACSSALCHEGHARRARTPLPYRPGDSLVAHLRARYQARSAAAADRAHDRGGGARRQGRLLRPHTVHCGPGGIFMSNLGGANGSEVRGGVALIDHDTFEVTGAWETDRGDQHLPTMSRGTCTTRRHLGMGYPSMIENGLNPGTCSGRGSATTSTSEYVGGQAVSADRPGRRASDGAGAEPPHHPCRPRASSAL